MPSNNKIAELPQKEFLIIVPVYNGEQYVKPFISRVAPEYRPQLLFVNDGSSDGTEDELRASGSLFVSHASNQGKGAALETGLNYARESGIPNLIVMDIDLQHPPELIPAFIDFEDNQVQIGYRSDRKGMPLHRKVSNFLTSLFISVRTNAVIKDSQCGFRAYPRELAESLKIESDGFQHESEFLIKSVLSGSRVVHRNIPVIYDDEPSQMNNVNDTLKFMILWFRSFFWI